MMKKVAFHTLGCKLNYSETSTISRMFEKRGYEKVNFDQKADIYIINTCSVTENADKKCRKIVRDVKKIAPNSFITLMGCYAQLKPKEISEISGVNVVLGAAEKFHLFDYINDFTQNGVYTSNLQEMYDYHTSYSIDDRTRTFLKIQDGCNYSCAFCTIPLARGKSRSGSIENIVKQSEEIAQTAVNEIVLTGVNIGDFGIQNGRRKERLIDLIRALDKIKGIERFRISSIEPNLLSNEIIEFVAQSKLFAPHFHIPLQSGSDAILKKMNRRYLTDLYESRINYIKKLIPHCCIGVDVIVGFPGETEKEFETTYQFLNQLDVSYLHVFPYSERPDTQAIKMPFAVSTNDRKRRANMLRILSEKKSRRVYEQCLNKKHTVLFEGNNHHGYMYGYTENYIRVVSKYNEALINTPLSVTLKKINEKGLMEIILHE